MDSLGLLSSALLRRAPLEDQDDRVGSARESSPSISQFLSTLVVNVLIFAIFFLIFLILRKTQKRIYAPRTYVESVEEWNRSDQEKLLGPNNGGFLGWIGGVWKASDADILKAGGLDGYFFLRYLQKSAMILFVGCCMTFPILFPLNIINGNGEGGLDQLSYSNVRDTNRLYAHVLVGWLFFGFVLFTIYRELIYFTTVKQAYLLSPAYSSRISSRTVLITSIPDAYNTEAALLKIFDNVKHIWINQDVKELEEAVQEREKVSLKLEAAEVKLIKLADKNRLKGGQKEIEPDAEAGRESGSVASRWVPAKDRPSHKLKPLVGEKVDTIDWCRGQLAELNPKIKDLQMEHRSGKAKKLNSAFIEFTSMAAAQAAAQTLAHHQPLHMSPRIIGISPEEIIWSNMRLLWWERLIRFAVTVAIVVVLVVFWSIPVAFVGLVSNVQYLMEEYSWLRWLEKIPEQIFGIISGLLPAVMLGVLMALLPIILRLLAKIQGAVSLSQVELKTQNMYFTFQVVQVFLITTLASAASASLVRIINRPADTPDMLAKSIPKATNFYIAYIILQGLTISSGALLQIVGLILYKVLGRLLDSTPRKQWLRWQNLSGLGWGTVFPVYTLLTVIALTYSIIAPLIMLFGTLAMTFLYFAYRYNVLFVYNTNIDTKGAVYPRAWYQTFTGIYLAEIVMIGLFGLRKAFGPLVLQVIFTIFTVLFQITLTSAVQPLLDYLPRSVGCENENPTDARRSNSSIEADAKGVNETSPVIGVPTGNMFARYFSPQKYQNYEIVSKLIPEHMGYRYTPEQNRDAFFHPAVTATPLTIWLPRDEGGVSAQEVEHTSRVIDCSDENAVIENGKVRRVDETSTPPGWEKGPKF